MLNENSYQDQVSIHVASQKAVSFIRRFYDSEQNKIYPYLTAILDVDNGVVKGIAWDDSCVFCRSEPERCEEVSLFSERSFIIWCGIFKNFCFSLFNLFFTIRIPMTFLVLLELVQKRPKVVSLPKMNVTNYTQKEKKNVI